MIRANRFLLVRLSVVFSILAPAVASADDFAPPPWLRGHPNAITAEWEFLTPDDPAAPDGPLTNVFTKGSGTAPPPGTSADIFGPSGWGGTSGGNWFFPPTSEPKGIRFRVDNVVDFEPLKQIRVQVTSHPELAGTMFIDPLADYNFAATGSTPGPVSTSTTFGTSAFGPVAFTLFTWDMSPNPPWEDFILHVTGSGEIRQVVVDTLSAAVPETSTIVSFALMALSVGIAFLKYPRLLRMALH